MRKSTQRQLQTCTAALLLLWSLLESLRMTRSIVDRLRGGVDACAVRNAALFRLHTEIAHFAHTPGISSGLRTSTPSPVTDSLRMQHRRIRLASSQLQRTLRCPQTAPTFPSHDLEWSITARYPTDGPLLYILSALGARNRAILEIDDARGAAGAHAAAALVSLHGWRAAIARAAWSGARSSRALYATTAISSDDDVLSEASSAIIVEGDARIALRTARMASADVLAVFAMRGQERNVLRDTTLVRPRVLLATYRDFLGAQDALWRNASAIGLHAAGALALDPLRGPPVAGYSLRGLADVAKEFGYRLVWCLRRFPVAVFVREGERDAELLVPTLAVHACFRKRAADQGFRADMEALWDAAEGHKWRPVAAAVRAP